MNTFFTAMSILQAVLKHIENLIKSGAWDKITTTVSALSNESMSGEEKKKLAIDNLVPLLSNTPMFLLNFGIELAVARLRK